jgi:hypothetical protein
MGGRRADTRRKALRTRGKQNQGQQISCGVCSRLVTVTSVVYYSVADPDACFLASRNHVFWLPDPDPLVRGMDPALDPDPSVKQK